MEDVYFVVKFFAYADRGPYSIADLQEFECPQHYDTEDDARFVAEYWMHYGFFRSVRCDKRVEASNGLTTCEAVFYAQKLDGDIAWRRRENGRWTEYVKEEIKWPEI